MKELLGNNKKEYKRIKAVKLEMSQIFDKDAKVIPFTNLRLVDKGDVKIFESCEATDRIRLVGISKGKGFAGTVKRWGFRSGPRTHGQDKHRSPGSIGTQGQTRVIPGKKMAGRMGGRRVTTYTRFLGVDKERATVKVRGAVPGSRNSIVMIYVGRSRNEKNEN